MMAFVDGVFVFYNTLSVFVLKKQRNVDYSACFWRGYFLLAPIYIVAHFLVLCAISFFIYIGTKGPTCSWVLYSGDMSSCLGLVMFTSHNLECSHKQIESFCED